MKSLGIDMNDLTSVQILKMLGIYSDNVVSAEISMEKESILVEVKYIITDFIPGKKLPNGPPTTFVRKDGRPTGRPPTF